MICEPSRAKEERGHLLSTRDDDAEVSSSEIQITLFLGSHGYLIPTEVLNHIPLLYISPRCDCSFMCHNGVSIGCRNFKGTVRVPNVDIFSHMLLEMLLLSVALEVMVVFAEPGKLQ